MVTIEKFKVKEIKGGENNPIIETVSPISVNINGNNYQTSKIEFIRKPRVINSSNELKKDLYVTIVTDIPDDRIIPGDRNLANNNVEKITIRINDVNIKIEELSEEEQRQKALQEILEGINDNFDLTVDMGAFICPSNGYHHQKTLFLPQELETIVDAIANYIENHRDQFILSDIFDVKMPRGVIRPWYSPENCESDRIKSIAWETSQGAEGQGMAGSMRKIDVVTNSSYPKFLHPRYFSEEQFEKLKNSLGDNASCKVPSCYNNYEGTWNTNYSERENKIFTNSEICTIVEEGKCLYHRIKERLDVKYNFDNASDSAEPRSLTTEDIEHNRKVDEYQRKITTDITDNNFRTTMTNFLAEASGGKFDEVDRDLVNKIRTKHREEENGIIAETQLWVAPTKIEVGDSVQEKSIKRAYFENRMDKNYDDIIIKKRKEILTLIQELQRKQDEHVNQNNTTADDDNSDSNQNLSELRKKIIFIINNALHNQEPKISTSELEPDNRNWEQLINKIGISGEKMNNLKERVLFDITGKREAKFNANRLKKLVTEAKKINDYEELSKKMQQIEKFRGQSGYNSLQVEINELEMKLAQLKPEKYQEDSIQNINDKLAQTGVKKDDLSEGTKKELDDLANGKTTDPNQIKATKDKVMNDIAQKCADDELNKLIKEYLAAVTPEAKKEVKRKLYSFISGSNSFQQNSYQKQKNKVDKLLGIKSSTEEKNPSKFPIMPVAIISLSAIFLIGSLLIISHRQWKKRNLKSI